jgi:hypothetical protein
VEENVKKEEENQWQIFITKIYDIVGGQRRRFEHMIRHYIS